mmetsp:Transcript_39236/g.101510  ORF Transcript_39236/g.101510 Transcript_39236/m.101510 type:complete len:296 (-) Transcript_39236:275-1162(-)
MHLGNLGSHWQRDAQRLAHLLPEVVVLADAVTRLGSAVVHAALDVIHARDLILVVRHGPHDEEQPAGVLEVKPVEAQVSPEHCPRLSPQPVQVLGKHFHQGLCLDLGRGLQQILFVVREEKELTAFRVGAKGDELEVGPTNRLEELMRVDAGHLSHLCEEGRGHLLDLELLVQAGVGAVCGAMWGHGEDSDHLLPTILELQHPEAFLESRLSAILSAQDFHGELMDQVGANDGNVDAHHRRNGESVHLVLLADPLALVVLADLPPNGFAREVVLRPLVLVVKVSQSLWRLLVLIP